MPDKKVLQVEKQKKSCGVMNINAHFSLEDDLSVRREREKEREKERMEESNKC